MAKYKIVTKQTFEAEGEQTESKTRTVLEDTTTISGDALLLRLSDQAKEAQAEAAHQRDMLAQMHEEFRTVLYDYLGQLASFTDMYPEMTDHRMTKTELMLRHFLSLLDTLNTEADEED